MKIRILNNSVRFRLSKTEVNQLFEQGRVEAKIAFGPGINEGLIYRLKKHHQENYQAVFTGSENQASTIEISLPDSIVKQWATSNMISLHSSQKINDGEELKILIEKDFKCKVDRGEDESDLYDEPKPTNPLNRNLC